MYLYSKLNTLVETEGLKIKPGYNKVSNRDILGSALINKHLINRKFIIVHEEESVPEIRLENEAENVIGEEYRYWHMGVRKLSKEMDKIESREALEEIVNEDPRKTIRKKAKAKLDKLSKQHGNR